MKKVLDPVPLIMVRNRQRKIAVDHGRLEKFAQRVLPLCAAQQGFGLTNLEEISVWLISDRRMAELHLRFMQIPGPTDVMTFQHGEVFISVETARWQAKTCHTSLTSELQLYLVHALLHLHGFDDRDPIAGRRMRAAQQRIIARA